MYCHWERKITKAERDWLKSNSIHWIESYQNRNIAAVIATAMTLNSIIFEIKLSADRMTLIYDVCVIYIYNECVGCRLLI